MQIYIISCIYMTNTGYTETRDEGIGWLGDEWKWDFWSLLMAVWILSHVNILHIESLIMTLK